MHPGLLSPTGGNGTIAAWYGGPIGSSLVLQKHVRSLNVNGTFTWKTVATAVGQDGPVVVKLCYSTGVPTSTDDEYRLIQVADPKLRIIDRKGPGPRVNPWAVWIDKASYLGTLAKVPPDQWPLGAYPTCP